MPLLYTSVHIKPSHRMVEISRSSFRRYKANDTCFSWTMASSHISIADGSERRLLRGPFFGIACKEFLALHVDSLDFQGCFCQPCMPCLSFEQFLLKLQRRLLGTVGAQMWFYLHQNQDGRLLRVTVGCVPAVSILIHSSSMILTGIQVAVLL